MPIGPQWVHEIKHDGFRFVARRDRDCVRVFSRHGNDWSDKVPGIVETMLALPVKSATLDGEGVMVDKGGLTDFDRLHPHWSDAAVRVPSSCIPSTCLN